MDVASRSPAPSRRSPTPTSPRSARPSPPSVAASAWSRSSSTSPATSRPSAWPTSTATSSWSPPATAPCSAATRSSSRRRPRRSSSEAQVSELYESSKRILTEAGYHGAGTCEFLVAQDGTISFLEVNTRLQVEHCVSEEVTGIDLVREMFRIAAGEELGYGDPEIRGHSIEFRINAEDGGRNFMPAPGTLTRWHAAGRPRRTTRRRLRPGRDHPRLLRLAHRQAHRHRQGPHPGPRALAPRPRRVRRRRHAHRHPVPPRGGVATRRTSAPPRRPARASSPSTPSGSRPSSTTRSSPTPATRPRPRSRASGRRSPSRSAAAGSRSSSPPGSAGCPPAAPAAAAARRRPSGPPRRPAPPRPATPSPRPCRAPSSRSPSTDGQEVAEGDVIVVMEAMKMEQPLKAHRSGTVTGLQAEVGATVTNGARHLRDQGLSLPLVMPHGCVAAPARAVVEPHSRARKRG